jgi:hypothetical protein
MSSVAETISAALAAIGPSTEGRLRTILAEFNGLTLTLDERLSVLATAIAHAATLHHGGHRGVYLDAVRIWSVEIATALTPSPLLVVEGSAADEAIDNGVELLIGGLDSLVETMAVAGVDLEDRLVTELALVGRLLGQHDPNTIHVTLMAVMRALDEAGYRAGDRIDVSLLEMTKPLARDAALAALLPRGLA